MYSQSIMNIKWMCITISFSFHHSSKQAKLLYWVYYASVGRAPEAYDSHSVCLWVSGWLIPWDSCSHFLRNRWNLRPKTCNAQCYLEIKLVNFGLVALLSSYGMICSPQQLFPAIQSPAKNKSLTPTWQFILYNKSDVDWSEIRRMRLPKLHSLSFA